MMFVTSESSSRCSTSSKAGIRLRRLRRPIGSSLTHGYLRVQADGPWLTVRSDDRPETHPASSAPASMLWRSGHDPPARHGVQVQHAASMTDRRIEVLLGNLVELELSVDEVRALRSPEMYSS